ncbi:hypothetical protein [Endozoicomonas sp. ONNA2]|uniref:hypothetical protein n=1 Tax=Endozoicomonas sp. ONNA2 TaxID=2828741 RepID=UPI0021498742|nr:hypothetical protein [Endozoicomonas sp. ONNA2]
MLRQTRRNAFNGNHQTIPPCLSGAAAIIGGNSGNNPVAFRYQGFELLPAFVVAIT